MFCMRPCKSTAANALKVYPERRLSSLIAASPSVAWHVAHAMKASKMTQALPRSCRQGNGGQQQVALTPWSKALKTSQGCPGSWIPFSSLF
eukprot:1079733-Pelagomonas_calceolata.AAC.1